MEKRIIYDQIGQDRRGKKKSRRGNYRGGGRLKHIN